VNDFLSRWSRRKKASAAGQAVPAEDVPAKAASAAGPPQPGADAVPAPAATPLPGVQSPEPLPPVESLTFDSDFAAFMQPGVEPGLRRQALKTLLRDPRFNVMDGLDVYIDDYSKPDPIPESWLARMYQSNRPGMFIEAVEEPPASPGPEGEGARETMEKQAVEPPPAVEGPDTSSAQISPAQVGKSPPEREGDPDVLV
jgi:hypothetical protein